MRRRHFLRVSTGALAPTSAGLWAGCTPVPDPSPELADPVTLGPVADDPTLRPIGEAFLEEQPPRDAHTPRLVRALLEDERGDLVSQEDPDALQAFLSGKIQGDFKAGRHPMGTTRMGTDPATSVVDADCRVHGMDNLFVAGSSCFTTSAAPNPTLTLIVLSLRTSDHVRGLLER